MDINRYDQPDRHHVILRTEQKMDLLDLNEAFLEHCISPVLRHELRRPPPCNLNHLDARTITRLAGCPFALFRLEFPNRLVSAESAAAYRQRGMAEGSALVLLAATFCRTVASAGGESSSLVLGLDDRQRRELLACSVNSLRVQESQGNLHLNANFLWAPRYWLGLVQAAQDPGGFALKSTRLQGMQLLAAAAGGMHTTRR